MIHKALYGLKSSGLRWSHRIDDIMLQLGFKPCKADPCVWLREMKTQYEYIAIYVDDLLIASDNPQQIIKDLKEKFQLKIKGDGPLEYHLGYDYKLDKDNTLVAQPIKDINLILESYKKTSLMKISTISKHLSRKMIILNWTTQNYVMKNKSQNTCA